MNTNNLNIMFFCESKNQVNILSKIAEELAERSKVCFFYTCWNGVISSWITPVLNTLPDSYDTFNSLDKTASFHLDNARKIKSLHSALISSFDTIFKDLDPDNTCVILGNDVSRRGKALVHVLRNRGIKFCLVQDGFLNFESKSNNLEKSDQNFNWGHSSPDIAFVWGEAMKDSLIERHGLPPSTINVSGPLKALPIPQKTKKSQNFSEKSILWVDQAILDQGKAPKELWLKEFEAIAIKLSEYDTHLRLHPSITTATKNNLTAIAAPYSEISPPTVEPTGDYLRNFDFVFCYYSTMFLDALAAGIPCIVYRAKSIDIELPEIKHPLIHYCDSLEEVDNVINGKIQNKGNLSLDHFVKEDPLPALEYADGVFNLTTQGSQEEPVHARLPKMMGTQTLEGSRICVLAGTLGRRVGAGIPISVFMEYLADKGCSINSALILNSSLQHLISVIAESDVVIINSMEFFKNIKPDVCEEMLSYCKERNIQILFYLHETEFVLQNLLNSHEVHTRYGLCTVLPKHKVLCVSEAQAQWFNKAGIWDTEVVYNASFTQLHLSQKDSSFDPEQCNRVIMVGTQQPRKGVSLFSHVADLYHEKRSQISFSWYGSPTSVGKQEYRSAHARFHAHTTPKEIEQIIRDSGIYFLSSIDDPFPLSAVEAIAAGVPIAAYRGTGMSEVIDTFGNGEVFEKYVPEAAYDAISKISKNYATYAHGVEAAREGFKADHFIANMLSVVQNAIIRKRTECENSPVLRAFAFKTSPPAASQQSPDFGEIDVLLAKQSKKPIDIAREALRQHRFTYAFRVSAASLRKMPSSSLHYKIIEKAVANLGATYKSQFAELTDLHKRHTSKST